MTDKLLDSFYDQARTLRAEAPTPPIDGGPSDVLPSLLDVRQRLDRVEELLRHAMTIRAHYEAAQASATNTASDAFDTAITPRQAGTTSYAGAEYTSAKERQAAANLATLGEARRARQAADDYRNAHLIVEQLRLMHRGLEGVRQDHLTVIRALQFETVLDR